MDKRLLYVAILVPLIVSTLAIRRRASDRETTEDDTRPGRGPGPGSEDCTGVSCSGSASDTSRFGSDEEDSSQENSEGDSPGSDEGDSSQLNSEGDNPESDEGNISQLNSGEDSVGSDEEDDGGNDSETVGNSRASEEQQDSSDVRFEQLIHNLSDPDKNRARRIDAAIDSLLDGGSYMQLRPAEQQRYRRLRLELEELLENSNSGMVSSSDEDEQTELESNIEELSREDQVLARGFLRRINELMENRDDEELTRPEQRRYNALIRQLRELIRSNEDDASNSDSNGSDESASLSDSRQSIEDENIDSAFMTSIAGLSRMDQRRALSLYNMLQTILGQGTFLDLPQIKQEEYTHTRQALRSLINSNDENSDENSDENNDEDSDEDSDENSDVDSDVDSDEGSDENSDVDSDEDSDENNDEDSDENSDVDSDENSDVDSDVEGDEGSDEGSDRETESDMERTMEEENDSSVREERLDSRFERQIVGLSPADKVRARRLRQEIENILENSRFDDLSEDNQEHYTTIREQLNVLITAGREHMRFEELIRNLSEPNRTSARNLRARLRALCGEGNIEELSEEVVQECEDIESQLQELVHVVVDPRNTE